HLLFYTGAGDSQTLIDRGKRNEVRVEGTTVGTVYVDRWESAGDERIKKYVMDSMLIQGMWVPVLTAIAALLLGWWLTRMLAQPLQRLIPAIQTMAAGDLRNRIPVTTRDEF